MKYKISTFIGNRLLVVIIFICIFCVGCKTSQYYSKNHKIKIDTDSLINHENLKTAQIGISIFNEDANQYLVNYQSNKYFIPASNVKLFTCYTALHFLKDSVPGFYKYETQDTLYIMPNGDPSFAEPNFQNNIIYQMLQNTNKNIVIFYDSLKTKSIIPFGKGWSWDDYNDDYMSERCIFPIHQNLIQYTFNQNIIESNPNYFLNTLDTSNTLNPNFTIQRALDKNEFYKIPAKNKFTKISIPFKHTDFLETELGILQKMFPNKSFSKRAISDNNNNLIIVKTLALDTLLKKMMYESNNFYAEQLLLISSQQYQQSFSESIFIDSLLNKEYLFLKSRPRWVDGSGLSRYNLFSPAEFIDLLIQFKNEFAWERIKSILPSGMQGTLGNLYKKYPNQIFAKSGTLTNHVALSGYLITNKNTHFMFSMMVGNHRTKAPKVRQLLESYLTKIIENY